MEAYELAVRAREIMARRGHCRGKFIDAHGRVCVRGAMMLAWGDEGDLPLRAVTLAIADSSTTFYRRQHEVAVAAGFDHALEMATYNDATDQETMLARLDRAIAVLAPVKRELVMA